MICAACGRKTPVIVGIKGVVICQSCEPEVKSRMEELRDTNKPVNVGHIARKIFREAKDPGSFMIRDIPKDLWDKAKHKAIDEGCTLREIVLSAVSDYVE